MTCAAFILTVSTLLSKSYCRVSSPFTDSGVTAGDFMRFFNAGFTLDGAFDTGRNTPCSTASMPIGIVVHAVVFSLFLLPSGAFVRQGLRTIKPECRSFPRNNYPLFTRFAVACSSAFLF